jgi:hypothetical protein
MSKGRLAHATVLAALRKAKLEDGMTVEELAERLGRGEHEVASAVKSLVFSRLVEPLVMVGRKAYAPMERWRQQPGTRIPSGRLAGYAEELHSLWRISDSVHGRTDRRQLCSFGLHGGNGALSSPPRETESGHGADTVRGDGAGQGRHGGGNQGPLEGAVLGDAP